MTAPDVLSAALYPRVMEDHFMFFAKYADVSILDTPTYFYGMRQGQEILVDLEPGKTLVIRLDAVSKPNDKGQRTVFFELNGQGRQITVQDTSLADEVVTARKADTANDGHVGAPMPGTVIGVHCAAGDSVDAGDPLLTLEAMKMETVIRAPHAGTVEEVLPPLKSTVQAEDLLVVMA
jgi:pyruvate carboxylase